jgi:hypothetical protein
VTYPLMSCGTWWAIVLGGGVLVTVTVVAQILEYIEFRKDSEKHSLEHTAIATGTLAIFNQLAALTQTPGQSIPAIVEAANSAIIKMQTKIERYESRTWQPFAKDQKQSLRQTLMAIGSRPILIEHNVNTDCAVELARIFKDAGWYVLRNPYPTAQHGARGLYFKAKSPRQGGLDFVSQLIMAMAGMGLAATADYKLLSESDADLLLIVGPKITTFAI